jgi:hypothetical protein
MALALFRVVPASYLEDLTAKANIYGSTRQSCCVIPAQAETHALFLPHRRQE